MHLLILTINRMKIYVGFVNIISMLLNLRKFDEALILLCKQHFNPKTPAVDSPRQRHVQTN